MGLGGLDWRQEGHLGGCYVSRGKKIRTCTWALLSVSYVAGSFSGDGDERSGFERYLSYTHLDYFYFFTLG